MPHNRIDNDPLRRAILNSITLPSRVDASLNILSEPVDDASILSCGHLISEKFARALSRSDQTLVCPQCHEKNVIIEHPVEQLRKLYEALGIEKENDNVDDTNQDNRFTDLSPIASAATSATKKETLLSLFYSIANTAKQDDTPQSSQTYTPTDPSTISEDIFPPTSKMVEFKKPSRKTSVSGPSSVASNVTVPLSYTAKTNSTSSLLVSHQSSSVPSLPTLSYPNLPQPPVPTQEPYQEHKEYLFVKCFPTYRRHFQYGTHSKFLKAKSKTFIQSKISASAKYFVLLSPKKWEVYEINPDSSKPPILYCCGRCNGEFGPNFENLEKPPMNEIRNGNVTASDFLKKLNDWEHLYCSIADKLLVISGTNGIFRVFDLTLRGRPIYLYSSNFPIRCIDVSPNSQLIAYGITGKDRLSGTEQALVVMHKLLFNSEMLFKVDPVTITFPYRDPINTISFSSDSNYLSCSTALESRFLTVLVRDADRPKLVMKSMRSLDTSLESEGITSIRMFNNNRYMCVTSVAFGAPPLIIDNNIALTNGLQTVAQPRMLIKLDEVGTNIHSCAVSPRNDSVALLDRNGTVYLMATSMKMDAESKRVLVVDQVSHAFRARESASLVWSKDGHRLYLVDRKGVLYVNDFAAGTPQNPEITRCKPLIRD
ncbi:SPS-sensor component PTR3 [Cyberlindnera fabianii]|uniref:SPS-sensor component PTR3 n=1 Tax=Cyberlindnera fabianii TaxID=36022 RepID=A0A1V2LG51_CYBFA|nr:SPS-sensor component PTR3 [Cyberlindnera fabianii]